MFAGARAEKWWRKGSISGMESVSKWGMGRPVARMRSQFFTPLLAPMMENRRTASLLIGSVVLIVCATLLGFHIWICPIQAAVGISCPGCGLTRAAVLLIQGDWQASVIMHAFAPVFLLGFAFLGASAVMPKGFHRQFVKITAKWGRRLGIVPFMLVGLLTYWILRLFIG